MHFKNVLSIVTMFFLAACQSDPPNRGVSGSTQNSGNQNAYPSPTPSTTGNTAGNTTTTPAANSCADLWTLLVQQQTLNATFTYATKVTVSQPLPLSAMLTRTEKITASSAASVTRAVTLTGDAKVSSLLGSLKSFNYTLTESSFKQACQGAGGSQAMTIGFISGNVTVTPTGATETMTVAGKTLTTQKVDVKMQNATLGTVTVSGTGSAWLSNQLPGIPIKLTLSITSASISLLNGATLDETLASAP